MKNEIENEKIVVKVFSSYANYPVATLDIDTFDFRRLLKHSDVNVRKFDFVMIAKEIEYFDNTIVKPIVAIYDKNKWQVKRKVVKEKSRNIALKTEYMSKNMILDLYGSVSNVASNGQKGIVSRFYTVSKLFNLSNKVVNKLVKKRIRN